MSVKALIIQLKVQLKTKSGNYLLCFTSQVFFFCFHFVSQHTRYQLSLWHFRTKCVLPDPFPSSSPLAPCSRKQIGCLDLNPLAGLRKVVKSSAQVLCSAPIIFLPLFLWYFNIASDHQFPNYVRKSVISKVMTQNSLSRTPDRIYASLIQCLTNL